MGFEAPMPENRQESPATTPEAQEQSLEAFVDQVLERHPDLKAKVSGSEAELADVLYELLQMMARQEEQEGSELSH